MDVEPTDLGAWLEQSERYRWGEPNCYWCDELVLYLSHDEKRYINEELRRAFRPDMATREHLRPRSLGGGGENAHIVVACFSCNTGRGNGKKPSAAFRHKRDAGPHPDS